MRRRASGFHVVLVTVLGSAAVVALVSGVGGQTADRPRPKLVVLDPEASEYVRVLGGPPTTVTMRSGYVILAPGKSMDKHSTEGYEEAVVVLEGKGVMVATQGDSLSLVKWSVAYCPPQTEHSVTNTGTEPLRYVYVVASAGTSK